MTLQQETIDTMRLFIEKANKLSASRFIEYINDNTKGIHVSMEVGKGFSIDWDVPDDEAVEAFVLTFRLFIQKNEPISFRSMGNLLSDPAISILWRAQFNALRDTLNAYLDAPPRQMQVGLGDHIFTRREIMEIFVYGVLAHTDQKKRRIFEEMKTDSFFFPMFEFHFVSTLNEIVKTVGYIASICELELQGQNHVT